MASKSKYISNIKTIKDFKYVCDMCELFGPVIDIIKDKKIRKYFDDNICKQQNVDEAWELFYHCICMSIDRDVDEYINSLEAVGYNKDKQTNKGCVCHLERVYAR